MLSPGEGGEGTLAFVLTFMSMLLLWLFIPRTVDAVDRTRLDPIPGFTHQAQDCPGCQTPNDSGVWHKYIPQQDSEVSK